MKLFIILLLTLSFVVVDLTAKDDDLVKLQKKEAKRRKKAKKATLVITNDNLKKLASKSKNKVSKISSTAVVTSNVSTLKEDKGEGEKKPDSKSIWQKEKIGLENSIKFYKEKIVSLQSNLNKLSSDFLIVDFPPSKNQIRENIKKTRKELKNSKEKLSFYKKELEKFFERARRQNIPPGWLR
jgi:phosphodiesterase/alkaline phosphatase D-like protein